MSNSLMDQICKYKVGDVVEAIVGKKLRARSKEPKREVALHPLQIIERVAQECYGGVQVVYSCRPHFVGRYGDAGGFGVEIVKLTEIEVQPLDLSASPESEA